MAAVEIIDASRGYADGWVMQADTLVTALTTKIESADKKFGLDKVQTAFTKAAISTDAIAAVALPSNYDATAKLADLVGRASDFLETNGIGEREFIEAPGWDASKLPKAVEFNADAFKIDDFKEEAPAIDFGEAPTPITDTAPQKPSAIKDIEVPSQFDVLLPDEPILDAAINLPPTPTIQMPSSLLNLDWGLVDDVGDASFAFTFNDQPYTSAMLDAVTAKLMADLANGGYGIEPGDESGLWERARDREASAAEAEMIAISRDFAARGFTSPPGALFGALEGIRAKAVATAATLSREVALKRADLYVQNRQFTIQQVKELESVLLNQHMAIMERVLRAAQVSAQFVADQYRARLDKARLGIDVIQARVQAFRDLVAAEVSKVEIYNAQIRSELAKIEIDKNKVNNYRARLAGVEATVSVYRLQVQAAEAAIQAERSKVELWKSEVDGYMATVKAKEAEFSGYEARIRGEQAKVQVFSEQVRAHTSLVGAKRVEADIKAIEVKANNDAATLALRAFEAELAANKSANDLVARSEEMAVRAIGVRADAYRTGVDAAGKLSSTYIDQSRLVVQSKLDSAKLLLDATLAEITSDFKATGFVVESQQKLVDMYKDMIGAALGGLNSIASISE